MDIAHIRNLILVLLRFGDVKLRCQLGYKKTK